MTGWNAMIFLLATAGALGLAAVLEPPADPPPPQPFISDEPPLMPLAARVVEIPAGHHGHYVTTATIDHMPVAVLVDTGATMVALSYDDADRIGLNPFALHFDQPFATANGTVYGAMVTLRRVEIENVVVHDVAGVVLPQGAMSGTLLGMSFLGRLSGFRISNGTLYLEQ